MRFKEQTQRDEHRALLRNQEINRQYEEKCSLWSTTTTKLTSKTQRIDRSRWSSTVDCGQTPTVTSCPQSPGASASSGDEEESLSDLEYNETSPLLAQDDLLSDKEDNPQHTDEESEEEEDEERSLPIRHVSSDEEEEDSMFSDSSCDMSDTTSKTDQLLDNSFQTNNNNNLNNRNLTTTTTRPSSASGALDRGERIFRETVQPLLQPVQVRPPPPMKVMTMSTPPLIPPPRQEVVPLIVTQRGSLDSPMSEGSGMDELDVNMATDLELNNVSMPAGKGSILQCLLDDDANNIHTEEEDDDDEDDDDEETKILNVLLCEEGNKRISTDLTPRVVLDDDFEDDDSSSENGSPVGLPPKLVFADPPVPRPSTAPAVVTRSQRPEPVATSTDSLSSSSTSSGSGDFDVYNIETALPTIDWAAMEAHLAKAAKETEWMRRRRNDREEIRRKLAMDSDSEEYYCGERVPNGKKPSLTTRLQSGMNLQICFMNETASDVDSQNGDHDLENGNARLLPSYGPVPPPVGLRNHHKESLSDQRISALLDASLILDTSLPIQTPQANKHRGIQSPPANSNNNSLSNGDDKSQQRPSFFFNRQRSWRLRSPKDKKERPKSDCTLSQQQQQLEPLQMTRSLEGEHSLDPKEDFVRRHARLQAEARHALAQAKEMARMQMQVERQRKKKSPIADIVGIPFPDGWHHMSRHILTDMNVAQLQVIVNDLHSQIESLNDDLVRLLLERDDLHMEQDSMLVDIEDLTRYLGAKDDYVHSHPLSSQL